MHILWMVQKSCTRIGIPGFLWNTATFFGGIITKNKPRVVLSQLVQDFATIHPALAQVPNKFAGRLIGIRGEVIRQARR